MFNSDLYTTTGTDRLAYSAWCTIPSTYTTTIMAHSGCDAVTIDMQHALIDEATAMAQISAILHTNATPLIRIAYNDSYHIMRALDFGAAGIISPMIETVEQAQTFTQACYYPPKGKRSYGPYGPMLHNIANYASKANENILPFAMIETAQAFNCIEKIAAVSGLRGLFVGPKDLTLSLTGQGTIIYDDDFKKILETIVSVTHDNGLLACSHVPDIGQQAFFTEIGFDVLFLGDDTKILKEGAHKLFANQA